MRCPVDSAPPPADRRLGARAPRRLRLRSGRSPPGALQLRRCRRRTAHGLAILSLERCLIDKWQLRSPECRRAELITAVRGDQLGPAALRRTQLPLVDEATLERQYGQPMRR